MTETIPSGRVLRAERSSDDRVTVELEPEPQDDAEREYVLKARADGFAVVHVGNAISCSVDDVVSDWVVQRARAESAERSLRRHQACVSESLYLDELSRAEKAERERDEARATIAHAANSAELLPPSFRPGDMVSKGGVFSPVRLVVSVEHDPAGTGRDRLRLAAALGAILLVYADQYERVREPYQAAERGDA